MQWSEQFNAEHEPSASQINAFVNTPLWDDLVNHLQQTYHVNPKLSYSSCAMQDGFWKGWNIKYKKSGQSLCTLYPKQGYFAALMPIGLRQMNDAELLMPTCTEYTQNLFAQTVLGHNGKSLAFDIKSTQVLDDLKKLITLRTIK